MSIMRASFVLTHRPGKSFNFAEYFLASMDEDFAKACPDLFCTLWAQLASLLHACKQAALPSTISHSPFCFATLWSAQSSSVHYMFISRDFGSPSAVCVCRWWAWVPLPGSLSPSSCCCLVSSVGSPFCMHSLVTQPLLAVGMACIGHGLHWQYSVPCNVATLQPLPRPRLSAQASDGA